MRVATVTFKSLTYAQKTKKLLSKSNIQSRIIKLREDTLGGCAYGLEFDEKYYLTVISIMKSENIAYGTVKNEGYK